MPLPPAPTQTADELHLTRTKKPELNKPPTPQVIVATVEDDIELEEENSKVETEEETPPNTTHLVRETINKIKQVANSKPTRNNSKNKRSAQSNKLRLFVLDTNVLMHDPSSLFRF